MDSMLIFIFLECLIYFTSAQDISEATPATIATDSSPKGFTNSEPEKLIYIPTNYVKAWAPVRDNMPLEVLVDLQLWAVRGISATDMVMEVELWVYIFWDDYRVAINTTMVNTRGGQIPVGNDADKLWLPILQFRNCRGCPPLNLDPKTYVIHYDTVQKMFFTGVRTLTTFTCNIDVTAYPMDRQRCNIQLENYYEEISKVKLVNKDDSRQEYWANLKLAEFNLDDVISRECSNQSRPVDGKFSCIELELQLTRFMGYHLTTTYAPTMCLIILSWISFWLPVDLAPVRITLGVTTLLTLTTRLDQAQQNLPAVSYVKAIDVWMFACIFLVFASLFEFAISFYWMRRCKQKVSPTQNIDLDYLGNSPSRKSYTHARSVLEAATKPQLENINIIDRAAQVAFPVSFLLFNICYWSVYLTYYTRK